jgi:hypothetical protein
MGGVTKRVTFPFGDYRFVTFSMDSKKVFETHNWIGRILNPDIEPDSVDRPPVLGPKWLICDHAYKALAIDGMYGVLLNLQKSDKGMGEI